MTIKTLDKTKTPTVKELLKEVELLRSFVIGHVGKDAEGEYKPEFVKKVLEASSDDKIEHIFTGKESLLAYLNENRD